MSSLLRRLGMPGSAAERQKARLWKKEAVLIRILDERLTKAKRRLAATVQSHNKEAEVADKLLLAKVEEERVQDLEKRLSRLKPSGGTDGR